MTTTENPPAGNPTVWLTLQAHDAPALIDFYVVGVRLHRHGSV